jgi:hypothetical protein
MISQLAETARAFDDSVDVAYLAETILKDERGFIELDLSTNNVRLKPLGRQNCDKGIHIPPSDV